jgi:hypothetical protein
MFSTLFADGVSIWKADLWYAVPAIVAISLVYAATRHENMRSIFLHAGRWMAWLVGFMAVVFVILELLSRQI